MQSLSIIDCPVELHLLRFLVKVKTILAKRPSHACAETHVSHVRADDDEGKKSDFFHCILDK